MPKIGKAAPPSVGNSCSPLNSIPARLTTHLALRAGYQVKSAFPCDARAASFLWETLYCRCSQLFKELGTLLEAVLDGLEALIVSLDDLMVAFWLQKLDLLRMTSTVLASSKVSQLATVAYRGQNKGEGVARFPIPKWVPPRTQYEPMTAEPRCLFLSLDMVREYVKSNFVCHWLT